ncbi:MAG: hypothetical protein ACI8VE_002175 [Natrialbaceae archaeon]|jgi:hypothetical protein
MGQDTTLPGRELGGCQTEDSSRNSKPAGIMNWLATVVRSVPSEIQIQASATSSAKETTIRLVL